MSKGNGIHFVSGGEKEEAEEGDVDVQVLLEMSGFFSRLVSDIFLNIMSRVPLSSLSQCRWVCKSWYKLIKSPSFAKIQYEWAKENNSPWVFFWNPRKDKYLVDDQVFDNLQTSATAHNLKLEFPKHFQTAGYVNGLLCVASDPQCYVPSSIYICNPITGEHILVPKSPMYESSGIAAFGFDPTSNDYKVIRFVDSVDEDEEYMGLEAEVYTLGSSEWRKIKDVPHIMDLERCGVLLNGNLHWIPYGFTSPVITVFNVGSEKFDVIQPPPNMPQINDPCRRLVVIEGLLCFLFINSDKAYEIWAMEDYGVQSSWVRKYSFKSNVRAWLWRGSHDLVKLRNGEYLLQSKSIGEFMGYFDPENDTLRPIKFIGHGDDDNLDYYFHSVVQVGSLLSPRDIGKSRRGMKVDESAGCRISG